MASIALVLSIVSGCPNKKPAPLPPLAAFAEGAVVHVIEADSRKAVRDVKLADDVIDLAWTHDARLAALVRSGAVFVVDVVDGNDGNDGKDGNDGNDGNDGMDKGRARAAMMPPANAWGSGPTNVRFMAHLEEQKAVKARLAAGEKLEGDYDQQFGSDPYPSMAKLVRMESGDVELVSCQFYDGAPAAAEKSCQDWVWSTLDAATLAFGRVSAPGPAYEDPDTHAASEEQKRARPPSRAAPLLAPRAR